MTGGPVCYDYVDSLLSYFNKNVPNGSDQNCRAVQKEIAFGVGFIGYAHTWIEIIFTDECGNETSYKIDPWKRLPPIGNPLNGTLFFPTPAY